MTVLAHVPSGAEQRLLLSDEVGHSRHLGPPLTEVSHLEDTDEQFPRRLGVNWEPDCCGLSRQMDRESTPSAAHEEKGT